MNNLESIVPPLELCKQIPECAFADSALVWAKFPRNNGEYFAIVERSSFALLRARDRYPAPTLAEIMEALRQDHKYPIIFFDAFNTQDWCVEDTGLGVAVAYDKDNPATAALKLWMEVNKEVKDE